MSTPWGYEVEDPEAPIIGADDFRRLCGASVCSTDERVTAVLRAVSSAVRDFCGWHVGPAMDCAWVGEGQGRWLQVPAMGVESMELEVGGTKVDPDGFDWDQRGMVRLRSGSFPGRWRSVTCRFRAGYGTETVGAVVAQIAANALVGSPGVMEQHADGVGVTYNRTADGVAGGVSLLPRDRAMLAPYVLRGVL